MRIFKYNIVLLFLISQLLYSQSSLFENDGTETEQAAADLPGGYRSLELGMEFAEVKELLLREPRFDFRGDPDVSMQKNGKQALISSRGKSFIDHGFFQFNGTVLYLIILEMNQDKMDFFSLQKTLSSKYGPPVEISPEGMFWENEKVLMSLEYPLTVKYLDKEVFNSFIEEDVRLKSFQEISRTEFLEDF